MQLKILKLGLLLVLKIHRQIILAKKIMKLVSHFFLNRALCYGAYPKIV